MKNQERGKEAQRSHKEESEARTETCRDIETSRGRFKVGNDQTERGRERTKNIGQIREERGKREKEKTV
jgi:hypothetical protein